MSKVQKKKSRDHVIVSSGWRHTRRVTFPGGARHAATNQRIALGADGASTLRWIHSWIHCSPPTAIVSIGEHLFADRLKRIHRGRKGDVGSTSDCAGSVEPDHAEDSSRIAQEDSCFICRPLQRLRSLLATDTQTCALIRTARTQRGQDSHLVWLKRPGMLTIWGTPKPWVA